MRIVDAKDPHALLDPIGRDIAELEPQLAPVVGLEIERIDVLVILRRVLRILQRAIRSMTKPLGMFARVGMVRRGLIREIERDLQPETLGLCTEPAEVVDCPEAGFDGGVPALGAADRPRTARIARLAASASCRGPCGAPGRSDGWAADRARRNPRSAIAGRRAAASRNVALRVGSGPSERGNISYQVLNRARSRSTITRRRVASVARLRSGASAMRAASSLDNPQVERSASGAVDSSRSAIFPSQNGRRSTSCAQPRRESSPRPRAIRN